MPKNHEEFISMADRQTKQLAEGIRNQLVNFIEASRLEEVQVAELMEIPLGEMENIIRGDGDCSITTFVKIITIADYAISLHPRNGAQTPSTNVPPVFTQNNTHQMPRQPQGQPMRPMVHGPQPMRPTAHSPFGVDSKGRPLPDPRELFGNNPPRPGYEPSQAEMDAILDEYWASKNENPAPMGQQMPPRNFGGNMPARDSRGRFIKTPKPAPAPQPMPQSTHDYNAMTHKQLTDIICNNLWDSEIDTATSTRETLVAFLNAKESLLAQRRQSTAQPAPAPQPAPQGGNADVAPFLDAMRTFMEQNPNLRDAMSTLFN